MVAGERRCWDCGEIVWQDRAGRRWNLGGGSHWCPPPPGFSPWQLDAREGRWNQPEPHELARLEALAERLEALAARLEGRAERPARSTAAEAPAARRRVADW